MATAAIDQEILCEFFVNSDNKPTVDRERGVITGVKLLGTQSRNKGPKHYAYPHSTLAKAVPLYEGAVCNVDHHEGTPVSYRDRIGIFRNVTAKADGLYGDFHFNPKHELAEQLAWDAEHAPEKLGFSQHALAGKINRKDPANPIVEEIVQVVSVDLVANPATTKGLFESEVPEDQRELCEHGLSAVSDARSILLGNEPLETKKARLTEVLAVWSAELTGQSGNKETPTMEWKDLTLETLKEHRSDLVAVLTGTDETSKLQKELKESRDALEAANTKLAEIAAERDKAAKTVAITEELKAAKLDAANKVICSDAFMALLEQAPDAAARKSLIEDRVALSRTTVREEHIPAPPFGSTGKDRPRNKAEFLSRL